MATTAQENIEGDGGAESGEAEEAPGTAGTATVIVPAGTFELRLDEACVITDIFVSALASSDEASLMLAGPEGIAVVVVELASGDQWSTAAADVEIDGTTMSYSGPAMGPGADGTISVQVFCDDTPGG